MSRNLSTKEIQSITAEIVDSTENLRTISTEELKGWLKRGKIVATGDDMKAIEDELIGFYHININEASMKPKNYIAPDKLRVGQIYTAQDNSVPDDHADKVKILKVMPDKDGYMVTVDVQFVDTKKKEQWYMEKKDQVFTNEASDTAVLSKEADVDHGDPESLLSWMFDTFLDARDRPQQKVIISDLSDLGLSLVEVTKLIPGVLQKWKVAKEEQGSQNFRGIKKITDEKLILAFTGFTRDAWAKYGSKKRVANEAISSIYENLKSIIREDTAGIATKATHVCTVDLKDGIDVTPLISEGTNCFYDERYGVIEDLDNGIICDIDDQDLDIHFREITEANEGGTAFEESEPDYEVIVDPDGQVETDRAHKIAQKLNIEGSVDTGFLVTAKTLLKQFVNMIKDFDIKVTSILDGRNVEIDLATIAEYQPMGRKTNKFNYDNRMHESEEEEQKAGYGYNTTEAGDTVGVNASDWRHYKTLKGEQFSDFGDNGWIRIVKDNGSTMTAEISPNEDQLFKRPAKITITQAGATNEGSGNMHGEAPKSLEKGKTYVWCGGAELLDVKYLGKTHEVDPAIIKKVGSRMGRGHVFEFIYDNESGQSHHSYMELSMQAVREDIIVKEDEVTEGSGSIHGETPPRLEKGKTYVWCGGAELLDIKYIGKTREVDQAIVKKISSSVGKGLVFQFAYNSTYMELSMQAVREDVIVKEDDVAEATTDGELRKKLILDQKKLFDSIYNMRPKDRLMLLDEVLEIPTGHIKDRAQKAAQVLATKPNKYRKALQMLMPSVHKTVYEDDDGVKFPMIAEIDASDQLITNPLLEKLKAGKKLRDIKINKEFENDGLPCVNCTATVGGKRYKFSDWHLERKMLKKYHQAEGGDRGALQGVKSRLTRYGNEFIREYKTVQKELANAKAIEEAAAAKNNAVTQLKRMEAEFHKLTDTPAQDKEGKKRRKELKEKMKKIAKEQGIQLDEAIFEPKAPTMNEGYSSGWRDVEQDDHIESYRGIEKHGSKINDNASTTHLFIWTPELVKLSVMGVAEDGAPTQLDIEVEGSDEEQLQKVEEIIDLIKDLDWGVTKDKLGDHYQYDIITEGTANEAIDEEYYEVAPRLKDICFQYNKQQITQDEAITQIKEVIKDSEPMQEVLINVAPEALVNAIISHFNWTESTLAEAKDDVDADTLIEFADKLLIKHPDSHEELDRVMYNTVDVENIRHYSSEDLMTAYKELEAIDKKYTVGESVNPVAYAVDAELKAICAKYYANLLPTAEAIAKARTALETCINSGLKDACHGIDGSDLMHAITDFYGWDAMDLADCHDEAEAAYHEAKKK